MKNIDHGNCLDNDADHHLYEIFDTEFEDTFKYGICEKPLEPDGSSPRANEQVNFLNTAVGWLRFIAKVLLSGIPGRFRARECEDACIDAYLEKHGRYPRGNNEHKRVKKK
jgi:hypothetical protein